MNDAINTAINTVLGKINANAEIDEVLKLAQAAFILAQVNATLAEASKPELCPKM